MSPFVGSTVEPIVTSFFNSFKMDVVSVGAAPLESAFDPWIEVLLALKAFDGAIPFLPQAEIMKTVVARTRSLP
jgi:hypothetical protein